MYTAELGMRTELGKRRKEKNMRLSLCLIVWSHFLGPSWNVWHTRCHFSKSLFVNIEVLLSAWVHLSRNRCVLKLEIPPLARLARPSHSFTCRPACFLSRCAQESKGGWNQDDHHQDANRCHQTAWTGQRGDTGLKIEHLQTPAESVPFHRNPGVGGGRGGGECPHGCGHGGGDGEVHGVVQGCWQGGGEDGVQGAAQGGRPGGVGDGIQGVVQVGWPGGGEGGDVQEHRLTQVFGRLDKSIQNFRQLWVGLVDVWEEVQPGGSRSSASVVLRPSSVMAE